MAIVYRSKRMKYVAYLYSFFEAWNTDGYHMGGIQLCSKFIARCFDVQPGQVYRFILHDRPAKNRMRVKFERRVFIGNRPYRSQIGWTFGKGYKWGWFYPTAEATLQRFVPEDEPIVYWLEVEHA